MFLSLRRRYAAFDLQKQQHQTDAQQDMADPGHAGDGRVHAGGKGVSQHLGHTPDGQHHGGQIQTHVRRPVPARWRLL